MNSSSPVFETGFHTRKYACSVFHSRGPQADPDTIVPLIPSSLARASGCYLTPVKYTCKRHSKALTYIGVRLCAATRAAGQTPIDNPSPDPRIFLPLYLSLYLSLSRDVRTISGARLKKPIVRHSWTFLFAPLTLTGIFAVLLLLRPSPGTHLTFGGGLILLNILKTVHSCKVLLLRLALLGQRSRAKTLYHHWFPGN